MVNILKLLRVIRPHIVLGGFLGYLAGALIGSRSGGAISLTRFVLGYLVVFFMDLSTHFNNDYFDVEADQHQPYKPFGNRNILIETPDLMRSTLIASVASTAISLILAALLAQSTSWQLVAIALLHNTLGWLYSTPPFRLGSRRLGEAIIAVGTGFCVPAVGYINATGALSTGFAWFSLPLIIYGYNLSLCLQIPDYEVDKKMGKHTVAGLIGRKNTYRLVTALSVLASGVYFTQFGDWTTYCSIIPLATSLFGLALSDTREDAKRYTKLNISGLFLFLAGFNLILLLNTS